MLTDLRVRDLGVIEDLSLTFGAGMTVLTGGALMAGVDIAALRLAIGVLLLLFGVRWLAKAIARHAGLIAQRDGLFKILDSFSFEQTCQVQASPRRSSCCARGTP